MHIQVGHRMIPYNLVKQPHIWRDQSKRILVLKTFGKGHLYRPWMKSCAGGRSMDLVLNPV